MYRTLSLAGLVLLNLISPVAAATGLPSLPPAVVSALARADLPPESLYALVLDADRGTLDFAWQADRPAHTASVIKVLTAQAALGILGPEYRFRTEAYATGPVTSGVLEGDLVLKGYGDPSLTLERTGQLLAGIRARGVTEIRGNILVDNSYFHVPPFDPAAFDGAPFEPYNVGPDAMLFNYKATSIKVVADGVGQPVRAWAVPASPEVIIEQDLRAVAGGCGSNDTLQSGVRRGPGGEVLVTLKGQVAVACGARSLEFALVDPASYARDILEAGWRDAGGRLAGTVRPGRVPEGAWLVTTHYSPALPEIVKDMNKWSNNVIARHLFLALGADHEGASLAKSATRLSGWLAAQGIAAPELVLENGAGLSRVEQIAPLSLARILQAGLAQPTADSLVRSLPVLGVDGTMRRRLVGTPLAGRAWLKSGTIRGVRGVAGVVATRQGGRKIVVALVNHPRAEAARAVQDEILKWAFEQP